LEFNGTGQLLAAWAEGAKQKLLPLPAALYTSPDFLGLEVDKIFHEKWICVGHVSELRAPGDYIAVDIVDKPILIVCDRSGVIKAFSNVCRHRGALLASGSGNAKAFSCPYHAWTYDLSGQLRGAPFIDKKQVEDVCLPEYRAEIWQGLVFVTLSDTPEPLAPQLKELEKRIAPYDIERYRVIHRETMEIACNWKVLVENFCESYHLFRVHSTTLEPDSPTKSTEVLEGGNAFNHHTVQGKAANFPDGQLARIADEIRTTGHLICVYPCLAFSVDPAMSVWLSVLPTGPQTLKCIVQIAVWEDDENEVTEEQARTIRELTTNFMAEDKVVIESVQRGMAANVGNSGVLHEWERTNWEFGQYLVRQLLPPE
jgi:phenylpropionate dioxygenase-like ring-hydroxylating dioxygenase large terminal subunit